VTPAITSPFVTMKKTASSIGNHPTRSPVARTVLICQMPR
jgi:hypothetical protein